MIHWTSVAVALVAGAWTAVHEPALPLFEQTTRALNLASLPVQLLVIVFWMGEVFVAMALTYALSVMAMRALVARIR